MKRNSTAALALVALLTAGLTLGACSSTSSSSEDVWRVGLQAPLSGSQSALGQGMLQGAQLAAADVNAAGGVLGRQIEIIAIDDAGDPETGVSAANAAIEQGLNGVVGPYNSSVGLQTLPLYMTAGLVPIRLTSDNATEGMGITLQPMTSQIAPVTTDALTKFFGAETVAILFDPTQEYTKTAAATVKTQLEAANVTVTSYAEVQPGKDQATYTSAVTAANADTPDAIYAAVYYPEGAKIAQAVTDLGTGQNALPCLLDYSSYDTGYVQDAGATAAQACNVVGVPAPSDFANSDPYVAAYTAEFNSSPGTWSPYTYDSVRILVDTVASVGTWDTAALTSGLTSISNWNGWTGLVSIEAATGNRVPATVVVTQVNDAGALQVDPATPTPLR